MLTNSRVRTNKSKLSVEYDVLPVVWCSNGNRHTDCISVPCSDINAQILLLWEFFIDDISKRANLAKLSFQCRKGYL